MSEDRGGEDEGVSAPEKSDEIEDPCGGWTHCASDCCGPCPTCGQCSFGSIWDEEDKDES